MLLKTIEEGMLYKASEYVKKVSKHFIWLNDCKYTMLKICVRINYETSNLKVHQTVYALYSSVNWNMGGGSTK